MEAIVQIRGEVNQSHAVRDTLSMLNLHKVNHLTFVPETDTYRGMITKVNDWVAHGTPSEDTVALLIAKRAEPAEGDADIDDDWVEANTEYDDIDALASALFEEETTLKEQGLSPTLRLHPPRGGHDGIKHPGKEGGMLGKQETEALDSLLEAMR
ncbi:50S ribosomal protein L30 [Halosegnis rubeus]|jgi:large subunit ribosomal protein L30|uniref:Large ribosomal subunit protein uL30 n=1 Tax=Halosegnis rubeus TaxID=2212850 RepID=A0A5N5UF65_9EURY|nr:50S ribosomal protein L30 [Halosegnis rubeus]KAB7515674.1 50S ribosomal protein L30 [Halosegnis rubeus]KAB7517120.1 50S ribosomal protein L30 [Halosegnis rubeus]KAB7519761.1 50S ribosomal protein L30 [Halosegnis rubeus]